MAHHLDASAGSFRTWNFSQLDISAALGRRHSESQHVTWYQLSNRNPCLMQQAGAINLINLSATRMGSQVSDSSDSCLLAG